MKGQTCDQCLRSLAVLGAVVLTVLGLLLIPWWSKMQFYSEHIDDMAGQVKRFESMVARKPLLEAQLDAIRARLRENNYFIEAATPALAAADLQQRVKRVVESNGGQLVSTQNLTDPKDDKLVDVVIRVRMSGDASVLARVLHELEGGTPLLLVDNLSVRSNKRYRGRGRERVVEYHQDVHFDLIGFLRGGA